MSVYDLKVKRMAMLLLPVGSRRPLLAAFVRSLVHGVASVHGDFMRWRETTGEDVVRTGQVCRLRSMLNDMFDDARRGIQIADPPDTGRDGLTVKLRSEGEWIRVPARPEAVVLEQRGFGGIRSVDFEIRIPGRLRGQMDMDRLAAVVDKYKLCSRRWSAAYYSTYDD